MGRKRQLSRERELKRMIGYRLKMLRKQQNRQQEEIAEYLGLDRASIAQWERGKNLFPVVKLPVVAHAYGIHDVGEFVRILFTKDDDDDEYLWRIGTGMSVRISGLYVCENCGDVRYFKSAVIAPKCVNCGETIWLRHIA